MHAVEIENGQTTLIRDSWLAIGSALAVLGAVCSPCFEAPAAAAVPGKGQAAVDFNRDIRPILSDNCFACHGPDENKRKAKLRLDLEKEAFQELKDGRFAIVKGDASRSELVRRVMTTDPDDLMPPPESSKELSPQQKDLLKRWVEEGAQWKQHWAFIAPEQPELPEVKNVGWVRNAIDRFILARLEKGGLQPSPESGKARLIRRVTLDLTGLPPTVAEVDAFLLDNSPDAYEKVVERLLGSPQFGERMAQFWLDLARYADTNGYHIDNHRDNWKWREWVVEAFNRNLPFDQFTIEQLAGDLLPDASVDQKIASGFNRNEMVNFEGGADPEEYLTKYQVGRVDTTATVWLGLTMACCECHDHKFDPLTNKDYYRFYAFFNTIAEQGLDGQSQNPAPRLMLKSEEQERKLRDFDKEISGIEAGRTSLLATPKSEWDTAQATWEKRLREEVVERWAILDPSSSQAKSGAALTTLPDRSLRASGTNTLTDTYEIMLHTQATNITGVRLEAMNDDDLPGKRAGRGEKGDFVLTDWRVEAESATADESSIPPPPEVGEWHSIGPFSAVSKKEAYDKAFPPESEIELEKTYEGGNLKWVRQDAWRDGTLQTLTGANTNAATYIYRTIKASKAQIMAVSLGSGGGIQVWLNAKKVLANNAERTAAPDQEKLWLRLRPGENRLLLKISTGSGDHGFYFAVSENFVTRMPIEFARAAADFSQGGFDPGTAIDDEPGTGWSLAGDESGVDRQALFLPKDPFGFEGGTRLKIRMKFESARPRHSLGRFRIAITTVEGVAEFADLSDSVRGTLVLPQAKVSDAQKQALRDYYRERFVDEVKAISAALNSRRDAREKFERSIPATMVMREMETPRDTHILMRGDFRSKGEKVSPGVPSVLPQLSDGEKPDRLALARWLVNPENPLPSRVTVNRFWQQYFGNALVKTSNDFGAQGEWPTHPELLDWLATEFIRLGWNMKALQRLIVTSAAYRQDSRVTPELIEKDPDNRLLARGPRVRLEAEAVRDTLLSISGLLDRRLGGESVRPYQPPGLWEAIGFTDGAFSSQSYSQSKGAENYRRGIYVYWKRSMPYASFVTFDAPTRETCTVKRPRTNTPLQALALLNDPVYVEAARGLAQRILQDGGATIEDRAKFAFRLCLARSPERRELETLVNLFNQQWQNFRDNRAAALSLVTVGESQPPFGLDLAELAAWTAVGNVLLNLDETITKG